MVAYAGDIVSVYCREKLVRHFGVVTEFNTVIDMAPRNGISERSWEEFSENEPIRLEPREQDDLPRQTVLTRAWSRIGDPNYSVMNNNCEHFVNWCRKGASKSKQVVIYGLIILALLFALIMGIRYVTKKLR